MALTNFTSSNTYSNCDITQPTLPMQNFSRVVNQEQKEQQFLAYSQRGPCYVGEESDADHFTAAAALPVPYRINKINSNDEDLSLFTVESILSSAENDGDDEEQHQHQQGHQYQYHQGTTPSNAEDSKLATEECHLKTIHDLKREISLLQSELNGFKSAKGNDHSSSDTNSATTAPMKHEMRGRWTDEEHELFLEGYKLYGRKWKKVAEAIKTRTMVQTRTHAQKYFKRMAKLADAKRNKSVKKIAAPGPSTYQHSISRDRNLTSTLITPDNSVGRSLYPVLHSSVVTPTSATKLETVPHNSSSMDGHNIEASRTKPIFRTMPQLPSIEVYNQQEGNTLIPPNTATKAEFQSSDWNQSEIDAETLGLLETIC